MSNLQHRQSLIQAKRKQTPWRDFVMEIASWCSIVLYKQGKDISQFPNKDRVRNLVSQGEWQGGRDSLIFIDHIEGNKFIEQLITLYSEVQLPHVRNINNDNSLYANNVVNSKNAYLSFIIINDCENILYSFSVKEASRNAIDSLMVWSQSENIYQSAGIISSYNIFYSKYIKDCSNIYGSINLTGCTYCIECENLVNMNYCFKNVQYSKEEFDSIKRYFLEKIKDREKIISELSFIPDCEEVGNASLCYNIKKGNNLILVGSGKGAENMYDCFLGGSPAVNGAFAVMGTGRNSENIYCSMAIDGGSNIYYSIYLEHCSFCLGCIGLKNKSYCILNKQYTKEERYEKVDEIFGQMEKDGTLGEFFPATMNPFYFNDTAAYLIDPTFTKEEVIARGYLRRDEPIKVDIPEGAKVVKTSELERFESRESGGGTWKIDPEILKYIIVDEQGNVYRIVKMEYDFLMKHGLPLPRKHWLDRMKENFRIG